MGSQSVSMGYQPYGMQVSTRGPGRGKALAAVGWATASGAFLGLRCWGQGRGRPGEGSAGWCVDRAEGGCLLRAVSPLWRWVL